MNTFHKLLFAQGKKKLFHVHGVHRVTVYFPDWKSIFLPVHSYTEQTSGCDDMVFRSFLAEILQGSNCTLTELDLIEDDKRIPPGNGLPADMGQDRKQI